MLWFAWICWSLVVFFLLDVFAFLLKKCFLKHTLLSKKCTQRVISKSSWTHFQDERDVLGYYNSLSDVDVQHYSFARLISYFPAWQNMGRAQKACNQWKTLWMWFCSWLRHLNSGLCLWSWYPSFHCSQQRFIMSLAAGAIWGTLEFRGLPHVYSMDYLHPSGATTSGPAGLPVVQKIMFDTTHLGDPSVEPKWQFR